MNINNSEPCIKDTDAVGLASNNIAPVVPLPKVEGEGETETPLIPPVPVAEKRPRRKPGPPPKKVIEEIKKDLRVPGAVARIREFHARILATAGDDVMNTVIRKALDPTDKDQVVCLKMCVDRLLPLSYFEESMKKGSNAVTINIVGVQGTEVNMKDDNTLEMEINNG